MIRADFFKALFTFFINEKEGLGHEVVGHKIEEPMGARDIRLNIQMKETEHDHDSGRTILVGFEGFTDNKYDIAVIRPLLLEKRWVEVQDEKSFCQRVINFIFEFLKPVIDTVCFCRIKKENIADTRNQRVINPLDIIDHKWEPQFDANIVESTKRDFLRFTVLGQFVHVF